MTRLVLGATLGLEAAARGALGEVIAALFPLPSFLPGLDYHQAKTFTNRQPVCMTTKVLGDPK